MSRQPILLDLFARAQGAAVGYARGAARGEAVRRGRHRLAPHTYTSQYGTCRVCGRPWTAPIHYATRPPRHRRPS
jgi:hypothetical protein